ncbi:MULTISPECIES: SigE family RNA polymerase sigma factor [Actinomadura]|uniref:SigE family RNA polymerase sigma factor n=1 Tax=Actinomadura yumaensis TaxID=111807 RepID=A0ABW2CV45_9ACTN|nr:SigE family RNA polymerase sigma factor [Actinomadura sp. J1-007]MWK34075.1 SigE family RNA polymerase sigma factor [Actinomadura sp. J1-007]
MANDPHGFQEFAAARGASLFRTACLLCGDRHLAEDLVQTTLGKLYVSWRRVQRADNPGAYARAVLMRTYLSHMRKHSSKETPWQRLPDRAAAGGADQALRVTLLDGLARLPPQDRAVLVLRYWEDLSVEDVASTLRLSNGAVRNRSMRALGRLREALGEEFEELIR